MVSHAENPLGLTQQLVFVFHSVSKGFGDNVGLQCRYRDSSIPRSLIQVSCYFSLPTVLKCVVVFCVMVPKNQKFFDCFETVALKKVNPGWIPTYDPMLHVIQTLPLPHFTPVLFSQWHHKKQKNELETEVLKKKKKKVICLLTYIGPIYWIYHFSCISVYPHTSFLPHHLYSDLPVSPLLSTGATVSVRWLNTVVSLQGGFESRKHLKWQIIQLLFMVWNFTKNKTTSLHFSLVGAVFIRLLAFIVLTNINLHRLSLHNPT